MAVGNPVPLGRTVVEAVGLATSEEVVAVADRSPSNLYRAHNQQILKNICHFFLIYLGDNKWLKFGIFFHYF